MTKAPEYAFPFNEKNDDGTHFVTVGGLTKREYFAAMAMQGLLATHKNLTHNEVHVAYWAVKNADVLIAELAKAEPEDVIGGEA